MKTSENTDKYGASIPCMTLWNSGGLFRHPKGMRLNWCKPLCIWKADIGLDSLLNCNCVKPERASKTDRYCAPERAARISICLGMGCWLGMVALFICDSWWTFSVCYCDKQLWLGHPKGFCFLQWHPVLARDWFQPPCKVLLVVWSSGLDLCWLFLIISLRGRFDQVLGQ